MDPQQRQYPAPAKPPLPQIVVPAPPRASILRSALRVGVIGMTVLVCAPLALTLSAGSPLDLTAPCCGVDLVGVLTGLGTPEALTSWLSGITTRSALIGLAALHVFLVFTDQLGLRPDEEPTGVLLSSRIAGPNGVSPAKPRNSLDEFS